MSQAETRRTNRRLPWTVFFGAVLATAASVTAQATAARPPNTEPPKVDLSKDKTLYVVGYAHLDTQWRWAYPQVIREYIVNTMRDNFALFEKYPHYTFNFSGSRRYEMMREYYPEDYAKVKEYVAQGRWFPCGSSVDENDANIPSAESFVRHVLYGNNFFRKEFGVASEEFMLPDCFGFPAALPTMLAHCGVKGFSTQKLTWGSAVGIPFKVGVWDGVDDTSVLAAFDPGAYTGVVRENLANSRNWTQRVEANGKASGVYTDYHYFGTGDRGGAPGEDSVKMVEQSATTTNGALKVISGPADWMFKTITAEQAKGLPHYKGELLLTEHSSGSITSAAAMKRWNRKNELLADAAERASVGAMWLGTAEYPAKKLYDAWDLVLGSQMHDILPGTSIPKAYEYSWNDELLAANQFQAVTKHAVGAVAATMDTRAQGVPLVVYNPLSIEREDVVEATVTFPSSAPDAVTVVSPDGANVAAQVVSREGNSAKILFIAKVPSVGFATYDVRPGGAAAGSSALKASEAGLENDRYAVTIDKGGDVSSIVDKKNGNKEMLSAPAKLAFQHENPRNYPAWNMDWADQSKPPIGFVDGPAKIKVVESGPVRVAVEVERESRGSKFVQTYRLSAGSAGEKVECDLKTDWRTKEVALKATFPMSVSNPKATYNLQVGTIERETNNAKKYEFPAHQWFDLTAEDGSYGVSVLNDSKFGSDKPDDKTLRLTLMYTPGTRGGYQDQGYQDMGRNEMVYALAGHASDWRQGETSNSYWQAARLNQPLLAFAVDAHEGKAKQMSLFACSNPQVQISAIKKAEDGSGVIVRLRETTGKAASGVKITAGGAIASARAVNGQEQPLGDATVTDGALVADVPGYGLKAFELKIAAAPATGVSAMTNKPVALPFDTNVVTTDKALSAGAMDAAGRSYPAEQFGSSVEAEGVKFTLGAAGANNAVSARGQKIALPEGDHDRVVLLAASSDGDVSGDFDVDGAKTTLKVQNWNGYVGQWDNRLWGGEVPELAFDWRNPFVGLAAGYVKPASVAWFCSHLHNPKSGNEFYHYSYIYSYELAVPKGAKALTLPNDPKIKVFAVTAVSGGAKNAVAATQLFDTLADHTQDAPSISPASGTFGDATPITVNPALYHREGLTHYTTDGSEPTKDSPVYSGNVFVSKDTTVKARSFDEAGNAGPVVSATISVNDTTPPKLKGSAVALLDKVHVGFSEPVDKASATDAKNYAFDGGLSAQSAALDEDGMGVTVTLAAIPEGDAARKVTVSNVKDVSPAGNAIASVTVPLEVDRSVYSLDYFKADGKTSKEVKVEKLPVKAGAHWTLNMFVKMARQPQNRTIIAGFGNVHDQSGKGKYMTKFANGIHHWTSNTDVETETPFELNAWQMVTTTYDGRTMRTYKNGKLIGSAEATLGEDDAVVNVAPIDPWENRLRFNGEIRNLTIWDDALPADALQRIWTTEGKKLP